MGGFESIHIESSEGVDPKFLAAKAAFDALIETDEGLQKMTALQEAVTSQFPPGSAIQQEAAKYGLYHAIIASGTPEFTPELIAAFDVPNRYFTTLVQTHTGISL